MTKGMEIRKLDVDYYENCIRGFLPDKIIDIHTHVWHKEFPTSDGANFERGAAWPARVANENPAESLLEQYKLLLPGKQVTPLIFGNPVINYDINMQNSYVSGMASKHLLPALALTMPQWSEELFESVIKRGAFLGCKVYFNYADCCIPEKELRIFDYLPKHQLEVLDRNKWVAMLHIPRPGRLKDPVNLSQLLKIEEKYPGVKLIVAHAGRAYCNEDMGDAFGVLSSTENMVFDISANTNETVFHELIRAVGPKRVLFGSDMPITRMRMRRVCEQSNYVNLVPKGLYGDVSGDVHMRELEGEEAGKLSFFLYEEINAFRRAAQTAGLSREDIGDVFYNNAVRVLQPFSFAF